MSPYRKYRVPLCRRQGLKSRTPAGRFTRSLCISVCDRHIAAHHKPEPHTRPQSHKELHSPLRLCLSAPLRYALSLCRNAESSICACATAPPTATSIRHSSAAPRCATSQCTRSTISQHAVRSFSGRSKSSITDSLGSSASLGIYNRSSSTVTGRPSIRRKAGSFVTKRVHPAKSAVAA